jgi:hypothetical protein
MTLPASGTISWLDIARELGSGNAISLSGGPIAINTLYRGGTNIPAQVTSYPTIPSTGAISADDFYSMGYNLSLAGSYNSSRSGSSATMITGICLYTTNGPSTPSAGSIFNCSTSGTQSDSTSLGVFTSPTGILLNGGLEVNLTSRTGVSIIGANDGVWQRIGSNAVTSSVIWYISRNTSGTSVASGTLQFRRSYDNVLVGSTTINFSVTKT